jgi:hypothetical protein
MPNRIIIKNRTTAGPNGNIPLAADLKNGELALDLVSSSAARLFVGIGSVDNHAEVVSQIGGSPSTTNPVMSGTASPGVSSLWSRSDHVHPSDTSRQPLNARLTSFAGVSWSSGLLLPVLTSATAVTGKVVSEWVLNTFNSSADAGAARSALGCFSMSTQAANNVAITGGTITGMPTPSGPSDVAIKSYVDNAVQGLSAKDSCLIASTGNVAIISYNPTGGAKGQGQITNAPLNKSVVDSGVTGTFVIGDRILLKDQSTGAQNGIWVVTTPGTNPTGGPTNGGTWDRALDLDENADAVKMPFVFIEEGTSNNMGFVLSNDGPITIGGTSGTALTWTQFSGAGQITAGDGLTKTANTLAVNIGTGASSAGLQISNDVLQVKAGAHLGFDSNGALKVNTNTSGAAIPLLNNAVNTWSGSQEIQAGTNWALSVNNDSANATTVTIINVTPNAKALEVEGKTVLYKQLDIVDNSPTIKFEDASPNDTPYAHDFWLHVNNNAFYILTNQNSGVPGYTDTWSPPHPAVWSNSSNLASFYGKTIYGVDAKSNNNGIGIVTATNDVPTLALTGPVLDLHAAISSLTVGGKYIVGYNRTTGFGLTFSLGAGAESLLGLTNLVVGDLLYASSTSAFSRLPATTAGYVLCSNQTAGPTPAAPFWGKVDLTNHITGWLGVANGGTGCSSLTSNGILYGNNTSAVGVTAAGVWDAANSVGQLLSVNSSGVPTWTNTIDGGSF